MSEFDPGRRGFLKLGAAAVVGVVAGEVLVPLSIRTNEVVIQHTNYSAGNAAIQVRMEESCKDAMNPNECIQSYTPTNVEKFESIVEAPIVEETMFRILPSGAVSITEANADPIHDVVFGTGNLTMNRRELFAGAVSSLLFGAAHNLTAKGFVTDNIPASQTVVGMANWYLQRKFGVVSNIIAHGWFNFKAMS